MRDKSFLMILLSTVIGFLTGVFYSISIEKEIVVAEKEKGQRDDKYIIYFNILDKWLTIKEDKKNIHNYFIDNGYKFIGIYGLGQLGNHLLTELKNSQVDVLCCIDKNAQTRYANDVPVKTLDMELPQFEIIVVTPILDFENIRNELKQKVKCPIVSLDEVINYCISI